MRLSLPSSLLLGAAMLATGVLLTPPAHAQNNTGLAFLRIGTSANALAMGSAQAAIAEDAFSSYWNPAGMGHISENSAGLTHHVWIEDTRIYSLAAAMRPSFGGGIGVFLTAVGSGDIEARSGPGASSGTFRAQFVAAGATYGRAFGPVSFGATAKFLSERIFEYSANGFAVDVGARLDLADRRVKIGLAASNFGSMSELNVQASALPRTIRAGVGVYPFRIVTQDDREDLINTVVVFEVSRDLEEEENALHIGLEAQVLETILLRGGWQSNNDLWQFSLGAGVLFDPVRFDYAYLPFRSGFGRSGHVLTLLYNW